jgi:hypothetical protein
MPPLNSGLGTGTLAEASRLSKCESAIPANPLLMPPRKSRRECNEKDGFMV